VAVTIRLQRQGRKLLPYYRVVVADSRMPRGGRYLELIGRVNPRVTPTSIELKEDRFKYWVGVGAQPSPTLRQLVDKLIPGYLEEVFGSRTKKVQEARKARKKRAKKTDKKVKSAAKVSRKTRAKRTKAAPKKKVEKAEAAAPAAE